MSRIYVIAGTMAEYDNFIRRKAQQLFAEGQTSISLSDFMFVSRPDQLRGLRDVHGYFIGTYRNRNDIREIVDTIRIINNIPSSDYVIPPLLLPQAGEFRMNNGLMEVYNGTEWRIVK